MVDLKNQKIVTVGVLGHSVPYGVGALSINGKNYGYPEILNERFKTSGSKYEITNLSIGEGTTYNVWDKYADNPVGFDVLIIDSGTNELPRYKDSRRFAFMSKEDRISTWNGLLDLAIEQAKEVFVLEMLPFLAKEANIKLSGHNLYITQNDMLNYRRTIEYICNDNGVGYIKRFNAWRNLMKTDSVMSDSFHPNSMGYQHLANMLFENKKIFKR